MKFLERLFGRSPSKGRDVTTHSFRGILDQKAECLRDGSPLNNHKRCFALLVPINLFGYSEGQPVQRLASYTSDACLFELSCYVLFTTDMWAFNNAPHIRKTVQQIIANQISHICGLSGLLNEADAFSQINSRLEVYGELIRQKSDVEGLLYRLKQSLHAASLTVIPDRNFMNKVAKVNAILDLELTRALISWDSKRVVLMDDLLGAIEVK